MTALAGLHAAQALHHGGVRARLRAVGILALLMLALAAAASIHQWARNRQLQDRFEHSLQVSSLVSDAQRLLERLNDPRLRPGSERSVRDRLLVPIDADLSAWGQRLEELLGNSDSVSSAALAPLRPALMDLRRLLNPVATDLNADDEPDPAAAAAVREQLAQAQLVFLRASQQALLAASASNAPAPWLGLEFGGGITATIVMVASLLALLLGTVLIRMLRQIQRESRAAIEMLTELLLTDPLTGARNRRGLDEVMSVEMARARRTHAVLTVAMIDLDYFKRYNSRRGHAGGDALLRTATSAWIEQLRPTDTLARYGGEEFTLVLPNCSCEQAAALVERLRPVLPDSQTFSAGIAAWDELEPASRLLERADRALMEAKKRGRNRTVIAGQEHQIPLDLTATV